MVFQEVKRGGVNNPEVCRSRRLARVLWALVRIERRGGATLGNKEQLDKVNERAGVYLV